MNSKDTMCCHTVAYARTVKVILSACLTFIFYMLVTVGQKADAQEVLKSETIVESDNQLAPGDTLIRAPRPSIPFSAKHVAMQASDPQLRRFADSIAIYIDLSNPDSLYAMIPAKRLPHLSALGVAYKELIPDTALQYNPATPSPDQDRLPRMDKLEQKDASGTVCDVIWVDADDPAYIYDISGDYLIPGKCDVAPYINLSPDGGTANCVWRVDLATDPCFDYATSIQVQFYANEMCTFHLCADPTVFAYNWCTGSYDFNWSFDKSDGWHYVDISPSCHVSSGGWFYYGVWVDTDANLCVKYADVYYCYSEIGPVCDVAPTSLTFPSTNVGSQDSETFEIWNTGCGTLSGSISESCSEFDVSPTSYSITSGNRQVFTVYFNPNSCGSKSCNISLGNGCGTLPVSGTGTTPPDCRLSQTSHNFQSTDLDATCPRKDIIVYNDGCETLSGPIDDDPPFYASESSISVPGGGQTTVTLIFCPSECGQANGSISFPGGCSISLSGTGTDDPECNLSETSIDFGQVDVGQTVSTSFSITNAGCGTLSGTISSGCQELSFNPSYVSLGAGQSETIQVYFTGSDSYCGTRTCDINLPSPCSSIPTTAEVRCVGTIRGYVYAKDGVTGVGSVNVCASGNGFSGCDLTNTSGAFEIPNVPYGFCYTVTPQLTDHLFDPATDNCCINSTSPECSVVFTDTTTRRIAGYVRYTTCNDAPSEGVDIYLNGEHCATTDATGYYSCSGYLLEDYNVLAAEAGHIFLDPNPREIHPLTSDRDDIHFWDDTKCFLSGICKTSCDEPIEGVVITATNNFCEVSSIATGADGLYSLDLPPGNYSLSAVKTGYSFDPAEITCSQTEEHDFVHETSLKLVFETDDPGSPNCPLLPFIASGQSHTYQVCVKDEFDCPVSGATVIIRDEVSHLDETTPPIDSTVIPGDCFEYTIVGGMPQQDKRLQMSVFKGGYDNDNNEGIDKYITVTGRRWFGETFTVQLESTTPLLILYDPPGDQSFSEWEQDLTYFTGFGLGFTTEAGVTLEAHAGVSKIVSFGVGGKIDVTARMSSMYDYRFDMTHTDIYRTDQNEDPKLIGPDGGAFFVTAGLKLKYGKALETWVDTSLCIVDDSIVLAFEPSSDQTDVVDVFVSRWYIENDIMPPLPPDEQAKWQQLLSFDVTDDCELTNDEDSLVVMPPTEKIWSGGGCRTFEEITTVSRALRVESELEIDAEIAAHFGLEVLGTGAGGKVTVHAKLALGGYIAEGFSHTNRIAYTLCDNDAPDGFHTLIYADSSYGTPVFFNGEGTHTMCPWEACTDANEGIDLINSSGIWADTVCPGDSTVIDFRLLFTGLLNGGSDFCIWAPPDDNLCGASVSFNGSANELCNIHVDPGDSFKVNVVITPNCACGPNELKICANAQCDDQIYSCETITIYCDPSNCPCYVDITTPNSSTLPYSGDIAVCANTSESHDGIRFYQQRLGGGLSLICYDSTGEGSGTLSYCCVWESNTWQDGSYDIIAVPVANGNENWDCSDTVRVKIDNTCPRVVATIPDSNELYVDRIEIEVSEILHEDSMTCLAKCFRVRDLTTGTEIVCQSITHPSDLLYKFIPSPSLPDSHNFEGILEVCATDPAGNPLCSEYRWPFTTVPPESGCVCPFSLRHSPTPSSGLMKGNALVDGVPAGENDCVAAFDSKGQCVGFSTITYVNPPTCDSTVAGFSFQIYGDDPTTPDVDEGMNEGELFTLRLYDCSEDVVREYPRPLECWTNTNSFPLPSPCDSICKPYDFIDECADSVDLPCSWSLISFCALNPDTATADVFAPMGGNVGWVAGFKNGYVWWDPADPLFSPLQTLDPCMGYWVKTNVPPDALLVEGPCGGSCSCMDLDQNWNLIGYCLESPMTPEEAFSELISAGTLQWVSGFGCVGYQWFDPYDLPQNNTLTQIEKNQGYWVKLTDSVNCFTYPNPTQILTKIAHTGTPWPTLASTENLGPFSFRPTQKASRISGRVLVDGAPASGSDLIAAFDAQGNCAGVGPINLRDGHALFALEIYGDDPTTAVDEGLQSGESIHLKIFDASTSQVLDYDREFSGWQNRNGAPLYNDLKGKLVIDFLSEGAGSESTPQSYSLSQNYPNPFNPTTSIDVYLGQASHVSLEIFNVAGQRVRTLVAGELTAGRHVVVWDGTDDLGSPVSSGIYLYRLSSPEYVETKKLVLLK